MLELLNYNITSSFESGKLTDKELYGMDLDKAWY
jgi:hypothetical protein